MKCLMIGESSSVFELFSMICYPQFKIEMQQAISPREAIDVVDVREHQLIIICLPLKENPKDFFEYLDSFDKKIPLIFTADEVNMSMVHELIAYHPLCSKVCYNSGAKAITACIRKLLRISENQRKLNENFFPMPTSFFVSTKMAPFDIFVEINKEKYIKIFNKGSSLSKEEIIKFRQKNVYEFHLRSSDYEKASFEFMQRLAPSLEKQELKTSMLSTVAKFGHTSVCKLIQELGIKDEVLEIADASINAVNKLVSKSGKLEVHLKAILEGKNFLSEHTLLTAFIATAIAREVAWESEVTAEKLTASAFFHDLGLKDEEIEMLDDPFNQDGMSEKKLRQFKLHTVNSAKSIEEIQGLPHDIDRIILMHHEKPDGTGFPHKKTWKNIFPMAAIFIVAHDFAVCMYEGGMELSFLEDIIEDFEDRYNKGNFKLAMQGLKKALAISENAGLEMNEENYKQLA